jgi:cleavage and polyadenylation specificity factor subunit 1
VFAEFGQDAEANSSSDVDYDQYLVVSKAGEDGTESTVVYEVNGSELSETDKGDFEREEGLTLSVGVLARGTKVVQVLRSEVRTYDSGKHAVLSVETATDPTINRARHGTNYTNGRRRNGQRT